MPVPVPPPTVRRTVLEAHHADVAANRDPADETDAEAIAYGLFVLHGSLFGDHRRAFRQLAARDRDLLIQKARFVLSCAADYQ